MQILRPPADFISTSARFIGRIARITLILALGAVLGILLLFSTGLYPGHFAHKALVSEMIQTRISLINAQLANAIVLRLNKDSAPSFRIERSRFASVDPATFVKIKPPFWIPRECTLTLAPLDSNFVFDKSVTAIRESLAAFATSSRDFRFEVLSVTPLEDSRVTISYRWLFDSPASPPAGIIEDLLILTHKIPDTSTNTPENVRLIVPKQ